MSYIEEIRRQAEVAPRAALPAVTAALWKAFGDGQITEAEAEVLSALIEARRAETHPITPPTTGEALAGLATAVRSRVGSRPRVFRSCFPPSGLSLVRVVALVLFTAL